jgi:hypothetical protein
MLLLQHLNDLTVPFLVREKERHHLLEQRDALLRALKALERRHGGDDDVDEGVVGGEVRGGGVRKV